MGKLRVHLVAGARPNFMKIAPLLHELKNQDWCAPVLVHTGQHYDPEMSDAFWRDLELPDPDYFLGVGSGTHAVQTAAIMTAYEKICFSDKPDWSVVVGDVNSTLACALTAKKIGIKVAHLEAGLRCGDMNMPEEINRILTDAVSDLLWTHSIDADENLLREGIDKSRIDRVGNIMIDSLVRIQGRLSGSTIINDLGLQQHKYCVVTLHRPANVDKAENLSVIMQQLKKVADKLPVIFPVHPRTRKSLQDFGINNTKEDNNLRVTEPLGYLDFMALVSESGLVITDSGGIQEETTWLGIPCLTVRPSTERPVTLHQGTNRLVNIHDIAEAVNNSLQNNGQNCNPPELWDGRTASRVAASLHVYSGISETTLNKVI